MRSDLHDISLIRALAVVLLLMAGCVQHTFDPTQVNTRRVVIETIHATSTPVKNVDVALFDDNTPGAKLDFSGSTGDTGSVAFWLDIPTFGHSYSLRLRKTDALGQLVFARTVYPVTLKCVDTTLVFVIPEQDTTPTRDSLCGGDVQRTLSFYTCADTLTSQDYTVKNCGTTPYTIAPGTLKPPFSIQPSTGITLGAGESGTFTITYDGRGQTTDASAQVVLNSAPPSGTATLTLIGHLRHDCNVTTQTIVCGQSSTSDSVRFGTVCQGQTTGTECVSFVNSNNAAVTITSFPSAPAPYTYTVSDNSGAQHDVSQPLTLQHGESVTLCFSITPTQLGAANASLVLPMQCQGGASFTYTIPISAFVKICNNCACTDYFHAPIVLGTNVRVGLDTTITAEIFHNDLNCPVTVSNIRSTDPNSGWTLVSTTPAIPASISAGGTIVATLHFKPVRAGVATNELLFDILPAAATTPCPGEVKLTGTGCNSACADITMPPEWQPSPQPNGPDTLFFMQNGQPKILVSAQGNNSVSDQECITIKYADTACASKTLTIVPPRSSMWSVSSTPSPISISPGGTATICLTFTAPTIAQVRRDFTQPKLELKYTDVLQIIDPAGCTKTVPLKAVVDTLPDCKEFDLAQYNLIGTGQVVYRESYQFDNGRRDNVAPAASGVPSIGDLYLKTATSIANITGSVPTGFFHWKNDALPICNNIATVTSQLSALGPRGQSYTTTTTLAQFDWIVVWVRPGVYALVQVSALYTDGFNIPHAVFDVLYPFYY